MGSSLVIDLGQDKFEPSEISLVRLGLENSQVVNKLEVGVSLSINGKEFNDKQLRLIERAVIRVLDQRSKNFDQKIRIVTSPDGERSERFGSSTPILGEEIDDLVAGIVVNLKTLERLAQKEERENKQVVRT